MQSGRLYGKEVMNHDFAIRAVTTGQESGCLFQVHLRCWSILHCDECWSSRFRWGTWAKAEQYLDLIKDLPNFREG
jgi:hypothetical protein